MKNKNILLFDKKELFSLDKNFTIKEINSDIIESEIEQIISNLWNNTCSIEKELRPLFSSFLQINLMRKLYIYYFSLFNLKKKTFRDKSFKLKYFGRYYWTSPKIYFYKKFN